jgi:hypothetical protein
VPGRRPNPFVYGKTVHPDHFVGRENAIQTIFARISNSESTAIVGGPHIGKSSLLNYIADEHVKSEWLERDVQFCFIEIDCHLFPLSYQPANFWRHVLDQIEATFQEEKLQVQLQVVRKSFFGSFTLLQLFSLLARQDRRVVLLIDEFDTLLHHHNFNTAEFFGSLRSFSTKIDSLSLVTASRMSIVEMNRRSQEINPLGSPFFNNLIEVRLPHLRQIQVDQLLDYALEGSGVNFSQEDRAYLMRATGCHPYLVQMAGAALFEAIASGKDEKKRYAEVSRTLQREATDHFEDVWQRLDIGTKRTFLLLALAERPKRGSSPSNQEPAEQYQRELRWLADGRLIEQTDVSQCISWLGSHWRVSAESFARWIIDNRKWQEFGAAPGPKGGNVAERIAALQERLRAKRRRLDELEVMAAKYGTGTEPWIRNEIKDLGQEIPELEQQIRKLQERASP